jgi:hypothetical protein
MRSPEEHMLGALLGNNSKTRHVTRGVPCLPFVNPRSSPAFPVPDASGSRRVRIFALVLPARPSHRGCTLRTHL